MFNRIYNDNNSNQAWPDKSATRKINQFQSFQNNLNSSQHFLVNQESSFNRKNQLDSIQSAYNSSNLSFYFNKDSNANGNNNQSSFYSITNKEHQRKNSFKFENVPSEITLKSRDDDVSSNKTVDSDSVELNKLLRKNKIRREVAKMIIRNQQCLSLLIEGDVIEYVKDENDIESKEHLKKWSLYMGNSMIMRFDVETKSIIYESYWRIADKNFVFINREYDKRWRTLPIYEMLKRARVAHENKKRFKKKFSSDKNFVLWCRFSINKSELDVSTEFNEYSFSDAKDFLMNRFLNSLDQAEETALSQKTPVKYKLTFLFHENKNRSKIKTKHD
jgi:hypothetical protein